MTIQVSTFNFKTKRRSNRKQFDDAEILEMRKMNQEFLKQSNDRDVNSEIVLIEYV